MKILLVMMTLALGLSAAAFGSNYPPEAFYQRVRILNKGPAVLALVSGGSTTEFLVLGYKKGREFYLSQFAPKQVYSVVLATCDGRNFKKSEVSVGPEYGGNGYVASFYANEFLPNSCYMNSSTVAEVQIAYHDGNGHWDSRLGENYHFDSNEFYRAPYISTGYAENNQINLNSWKVIVDALREGN